LVNTLSFKLCLDKRYIFLKSTPREEHLINSIDLERVFHLQAKKFTDSGVSHG